VTGARGRVIIGLIEDRHLHARGSYIELSLFCVVLGTSCPPPCALTAFFVPGIARMVAFVFWPLPLVSSFWAFISRLLPNSTNFSFNFGLLRCFGTDLIVGRSGGPFSHTGCGPQCERIGPPGGRFLDLLAPENGAEGSRGNQIKREICVLQ
jgi:hypothetical protein